MQLESVTIAGFKSFAKKTTIQVPPGITAIVGPNGSGKSNIADAIRWVLGEQSMKTLRGKKSDDVIFAGTEKKSRLGLAEVTLTLKNSKKNKKFKYNTISITRRVFRDGEGEYRINKNKVRLIDVQELLATAGFGQQTYGVIGQGMIDSLLKASPKELREMFYDACGVRAFHIKKMQSEKKLARTRDNLVKGQAVIAEIEPRLRALVRIAGKAEKYKEAIRTRDEVFDIYFGSKYATLERIAQKAKKDMQELATLSEKKQKKIDQIKAQRNQLLSGISQKEKQSLERKRGELERKISQNERSRYLADGKIALEIERSKSADTSYLESQIQDLKEKISSEKSKSIKKEIADLEKNEKQKKIELDKQKNQVNKAESEFADFQKKSRKRKVTLFEVKDSLILATKKNKAFVDALHKCKTIADIEKLKKDANFQLKEYQSVISKLETSQQKNVIEKQNQLQSVIDQAKQQFEKARMNHLHATQSLSIAKNTAKIQAEMLRDLEGQLEKLNKKLSEAKNKKADTEKIAKLEKEKNNLEKEKAQLEKEKKAVEALLQKIDQSFFEAQKNIQEIEKHFEAHISELNTIKDNIRTKEIEIADTYSKKQSIFNELVEHLGLAQASEKADAYTRKKQILTDSELKPIEKKLRAALSSIRSIGDIDEDAIKEYEEVKKRHEFLIEQEKDLQEAEKKLRKIIAELSVNIEKTFNQSFSKIAHRFKDYFKILFNGGNAKISKTKIKRSDEDEEEKDLDDTLIEIFANPPGKKLQGLSMMSGGERALTSIALLMAIIENNPPPFIVLDEVDAALDEANSERFSKILLDAQKKSQVVAITHNRATMNKAKVLYGVTMQESGISKLLSVKLEKALEIKEK